MNGTVVFTKEDYLNYHLYEASQSKRIKNNRRRTYSLLIGIFLSLFLILYLEQNTFLSIYFAIAAFLTLIFYPIYQRKHYKDHYDKFIEENYKGMIGVTCNVEMNGESIYCADLTGDGRFYRSEISGITETKDYYYVKVKTGRCMILPKRFFDEQTLINEMETTAETNQFDIKQDLNWKWR